MLRNTAVLECSGMSPDVALRASAVYRSALSISRVMRQAPSRSRRQIMRQRLRTLTASEPSGPLTHVARPSVAARSPVPIVESAAISIDEMLT